MKNLFYLFAVVALVASSVAFADDDDWGRGYGYGGRPHCNRGWGHHRGGYYPRQQINNYYPQPQVNYYYPQPPVNYYPPRPQYYGGGYGYDGRSHQGLAGGVVGTVFGYELGNGNPLAAGLGAAAGSFLGNGVGWRY